MVVINTKKIFITILVSALLLVGSALTVFAFDFSTPEMPSDGTEGFMQLVFNGEPTSDNIYSYPLMIFFCDNSNSPYSAYMYLTYTGFEYFSQNGSDFNSVYQYIDDFLSGNVGNAFCNAYKNDGTEGLAFLYYESPNIVEYYTTDYFDYRIEDSLRAQYYNYESQYNALQSEYNTLYSELNDLRYKYATLVNQYQDLLTEYQNLQTVKSDLQTALQELANEYNTLTTQYGELRLQYETLETQYNVLFTSYNDLVDFYSEELTRLLNENNELRSYLQTADTQINNLEAEINRLKEVVAQEYMKGYTQAFEDYDIFEDGLYSIFSAPFTIIYELSEIEIFGFSIVRIVGIILLFVVLSFILAFIWKVIPLL